LQPGPASGIAAKFAFQVDAAEGAQEAGALRYLDGAEGAVQHQSVAPAGATIAGAHAQHGVVFQGRDGYMTAASEKAREFSLFGRSRRKVDREGRSLFSLRIPGFRIFR